MQNDRLAILKITDEALTPDEQDVGVQRFDPVIGVNLPAGRYYELAKPHFDRTDEWLAPSEVGTTLAHMSVWRHVVETGRGAVILEADVRVEREMLETLQRAALAHDAPFILLGYYEVAANRGIRRVRPHPSGLLLRDAKQRLEGAFAYYASPETAAALLAFHEREFRLADAWSEFFAEQGVEPLYLPLVSHGDAHGANKVARMGRASHWTLLRRFAFRAKHYVAFRWFRATARLRGWQPDDCGASPIVRDWRQRAALDHSSLRDDRDP